MSERVEKNWLEWVVFSVSLALILLAVGYLAYDAATRKGTPPVLEVRLGTPEQRGGEFAVPVTVLNHGDMTAEGVRIEVMVEGGADGARGEIVIAFVPRLGQREGWVIFRQDPRGARLEAHVLGYEKP